MVNRHLIEKTQQTAVFGKKEKYLYNNVKGNLGPVNCNQGALEKQQFAAIIGNLHFFVVAKNSIFLIFFYNKCVIDIYILSL